MPQPVRLNAGCSPLIIRDSLPGRVARTRSPGVTARAGKKPRQWDCRARVPPLPDPVPFCRASKAQRALTALNVRYFVYPPPVNATSTRPSPRRHGDCTGAGLPGLEQRRPGGGLGASRPGQEGPGARIWRNGTAGVNRPQRWPRRSAMPGAGWRHPAAAAGATGGGPSLPRLRSCRRRQTPVRGGLDRIERQGHLDAVSAGP